jgi:ferrochelatase
MLKKLSTLLSTALFSLTSNAEPLKVGVLFSSFGDVDSLDEVEAFVKKTLRDPDVVPVPRWMLPIVVDLGWHVSQKDILAEYSAINGRTNFRKNSQLQADAVAQALNNNGYDAKGYTGFTMTFPDISEPLAQAKADGVNELVVFYQGAQWSGPTAQIVQRETSKFLKGNMDWDVRVTMVRSFSDDPRFQNLIIDDISQRLNTDFSSTSVSDLCIVLPAHGNPLKVIKAGDPAYAQMMRVFDSVRKAFPDYKVFHGFQNHSEIPTLKWTTPELDTVAKDIAANECSQVLVNGRTSYTIDSLETLFDHSVGFTDELRSLNPNKTIIVENMYNSEERFVNLMAQLAMEAMQGQGDIARLR